MFYIKTKLPDGKPVKTEVTDENVFTRCSECGKEISVDLAELFSDGNGDWTAALAMQRDMHKAAMGTRSKRYAMLVTDGVLTWLGVDESGLRNSSADAVQAALPGLS